MRAVEVERAGQGNNGAVGSRFREHGQITWAMPIVFLGMMTSACAAPELRALAAGETGMASITEPTVLAELELDLITAAGVAVDVASFAGAHGDLTLAATGADTITVSREAYDLGLGFTRGLALACCGEEAEVEVASIAVGSGDIVRSTTHSAEQDGGDGRRWAHGNSVGFVLALSFKKNWGGAGDQREAIVGELNATYADLNTQMQAGALNLRPSNDR